MPTSYPNSLDSFTDPTATSVMSTLPHHSQHANANDAIAALETFVGTASAPGLAFSILNRFSISASVNAFSGSGAANQNVLTGLTGHDFQVGQGIRVYGAGGIGGLAPPGAPTVSASGPNSGTVTYQYQVANTYNSRQIDATSAASTASTFSGNSTLDATHFNKIQFTPVANVQLYSIYGRTPGSMNLIGHLWFWGPTHYTVALSSPAPPYLGSNLAASTQYTYAITGVDFMGNESPVLTGDTGVNQIAVTTGGTVTGVTITWDFGSSMVGSWRYFNIYRATGAGRLQFMQQVNALDLCWQDDGLVAPNAGQNPPTVLTFVDNGQPSLTGTAARLPSIPASPPSAGVGNSLYSTVTAVTATTVTLANNLGATVTNTTVIHDDSVALQNALNALNTVTLPNGVYPIGQPVNVPQGGCLQGLAPPAPVLVTVTTTNNPLPNPNAATLVFTSFYGVPALQSSLRLGQPGVGSNGSACRNLQLFWPYQANGTHAIQQVIPFGPAIDANGIDQQVTDIVDCNSYIGVFARFGAAIIERFWCAFLRFEVLAIDSECIFRRFKGDPATVYSGNVNLVQFADRSVVRGTASGLPIFETSAVDGATAFWWTLSTGGTSGMGNIGPVINDAWVDDWTPACVIDCPTSEPYSGNGGSVGTVRINNFFSMAGGGSLNITNLQGRIAAGANDTAVFVNNSYFAGGTNLVGQMHAHFANSAMGVINSTAKSKIDSTPAIHLSLVGCPPGIPRLNTIAGATKARIAGSANWVSNYYINDTITGGTLYVIDEQGIATEDFAIPANTALTAGAVTVGYIHLPQQTVANNLYVITAAGNGTSATDIWKLNGSTLFTTAASVSSQFVGAAGEGVGNNGGTGLPPTQALYFFAGTAGTGFNVLPVVLNVAANITPTVPIKCRITYCISPLSA